MRVCTLVCKLKRLFGVRRNVFGGYLRKSTLNMCKCEWVCVSSYVTLWFRPFHHLQSAVRSFADTAAGQKVCRFPPSLFVSRCLLIGLCHRHPLSPLPPCPSLVSSLFATSVPPSPCPPSIILSVLPSAQLLLGVARTDSRMTALWILHTHRVSYIQLISSNGSSLPHHCHLRTRNLGLFKSLDWDVWLCDTHTFSF